VNRAGSGHYTSYAVHDGRSLLTLISFYIHEFHTK